MSLNGFTRTCAKCNGGVKSLALIEIDRISSVAYDASTDSFTAVTLSTGAAFAFYDFVEASCSLTETCSFKEGSSSVEHRLAFALPRADAASIRAAAEIAAASCTGIAALVETMLGDRFLVGYSTELTTRRGLTVEQITSSSGARTADSTAVEVVLHSIDTSLSRPFTGTL